LRIGREGKGSGQIIGEELTVVLDGVDEVAIAEGRVRVVGGKEGNLPVEEGVEGSIGGEGCCLGDGLPRKKMVDVTGGGRSQTEEGNEFVVECEDGLEIREEVEGEAGCELFGLGFLSPLKVTTDRIGQVDRGAGREGMASQVTGSKVDPPTERGPHPLSRLSDEGLVGQILVVSRIIPDDDDRVSTRTGREGSREPDGGDSRVSVEPDSLPEGAGTTVGS
jgi:hypothetical protein